MRIRALALVLALATPAGDQLDLFTVQQGRVVLDATCVAGAPVPWDASTHLQAGEPVVVLGASGMSQAVVGALRCWEGECKGNYRAIDLEPGSDGWAVLPQRQAAGLRTDPLQAVDAGKATCEGLFAKDDSITCRRLELPGGTAVAIARRSHMQENGIARVEQQVRIVAPAAGPVVELEAPLEPVLLLRREGHPAQVLWRFEGGICCPREVVLRTSTAGTGGVLRFGPPVKAGGQPCD